MDKNTSIYKVDKHKVSVQMIGFFHKGEISITVYSRYGLEMQEYDTEFSGVLCKVVVATLLQSLVARVERIQAILCLLTK